MIHFAHIINPVKVNKSSGLYFAQTITFESMKIAQAEAKSTLQVDLMTTQYEEDIPIIPDGFNVLPNLDRSVLDLKAFSKPVKYPLIRDILDRAYQNSNAEFIIFTNVDIGLQKHFYTEVEKYINAGHDAIIINRRRVEDKYQSIDDLPELYKDKGKSHPGFDCFVIKRDLLPSFRLDEICVGIPFIGVSLAHNLFCLADNLILLDKEFLTFHIGMEVMPKHDQQYYWYNRNQFNVIWEEVFKPNIKLKNLPYINENVISRYWKWGMNPSLFVFKYLQLEIEKLIGK